MEMPPIFYEVHSNLPREGPGDKQSTRKAFRMLKNLPANPRILDVGCGPGMQTVEVAKLSGGHIIALDSHQPFLDQLTINSEEAGVSYRIKPVKGDMFTLQYLTKSFDLIWCEGAIFIIGFEKGLTEWKPLLANKGYLVLSELTWLRTDRPHELDVYMKQMYEGLGESVKTIEENTETAKKAGYQVINTFILPKKGWLDNYYRHIEAKLPRLKAKHKNEPENLQYLAAEEKEIKMFRKYNNYYGYVFYVLQAV